MERSVNLAQPLLQTLASPRGLWVAVAAAVATLVTWGALLGAEIAAADGPKSMAPPVQFAGVDGGMASATLRLAGSGSTVAALRIAVAECGRAGQRIDVQVEQGIGSSGGLRALADGAIDAALVSRQLKAAEQRGDWAAAEYARSAVTFASLAHGLDDTDGQNLLHRLAEGSPPGPTGRPLTWLLRESGDSGHLVMAQRSPAFAQLERRARAGDSAQIYFHDRTLHAALLSAEGTVGVVDASAVRAEGLPLQLYRWGSTLPDAAAVASGAWPFAKPHMLVYPTARADRLAPLLACLKSTAGRDALARLGAAPSAL